MSFGDLSLSPTGHQFDRFDFLGCASFPGSACFLLLLSRLSRGLYFQRSTNALLAAGLQ